MKKSLIVFLLAGICGCFNRQPAIKTGFEGKPIPSFDLLLADSTTHFNTNTIPNGKPVVFFLFQPWCPYCKAQTEAMLKHIQSVKDIHFYLLTTSSYSQFKQFYDRYKLNKYPNITAGIDGSRFFGTYFQAKGVPYQAIYDQNRRLKRVLIGPSDMNLIKEISFE
jgi:thiol-disulfide isomerase/thioredoxin